ncbi:MAG: hypothetical protein MHPSP_004571, partial [Paramarteilia canceri]
IGSQICPHHIGHHIGSSLHDCPNIMAENEILRNGMCFTIEPGVYIGNNNSYVKSEYHNIGVRIEDCCAIRNGRIEILSKDCPKDSESI